MRWLQITAKFRVILLSDDNTNPLDITETFKKQGTCPSCMGESDNIIDIKSGLC